MMSSTPKEEFEEFSDVTERNLEQIDSSRDDEEGDEIEGFRIVDDDLKRRYLKNWKIFVLVFLVLGIVALLLLFEFNAKFKSIFYLNFIQTYRKLTLTEKIEYASIPGEYMDINKIKEFKELPFCFISDEDSKWSATPDRMGNYTNYKVILTNNKGFNYYRFHLYIEKCQKNSILIFVDKMERFNLAYLNEIHQRNQVWLTYYKKDNSMEIVSVYLRVWELVGMNAFTDENRKILDSFDEEVNIQHITTSLFELCLNNLQHVRNKFSSFSSFSKLVLLHSSTPIVRTPYQTLYKLSQDYYVKEEFVEKPITTLKRLKSKADDITPVKMKRALEFEEILYLPLNHSLLELEYLYYRSRELLIEEKEEVRFCVTVLNRNNVDRNRYKKAFNTIFQQNYSNFYVVFVDDNSTDGNTGLAIKYLKELNQSVKVTIVQNLEQKFATYNIINAAFNYCGADDVQMLLDGDDEFIGRYAFQVINSQYQKKKSWVVYSSYKSNFNEYGASHYFDKMEHIVKDNKRQKSYFIGPVRTWKVKLLHAIPLKHHLNPDGLWLDTIYDEAIQFPLFELCGTVQRATYIPELLYEYNRLYSVVNDYTGEAKENRFRSYYHVLEHEPLKKVENLEEIKQNREVMEVLEKDRGVKYELIKWV